MSDFVGIDSGGVFADAALQDPSVCVNEPATPQRGRGHRVGEAREMPVAPVSRRDRGVEAALRNLEFGGVI